MTRYLDVTDMQLLVLQHGVATGCPTLLSEPTITAALRTAAMSALAAKVLPEAVRGSDT